MPSRHCRRTFTSLEVVLLVLFTLMTAVITGLFTVLALEQKAVQDVQYNPEQPQTRYWIGVGRGDCTGPAADLPLMGYANPNQVAGGLHTRLFSRAFIVSDGSKRVVFVSVDIGMMSQRLRLEVLNKLQMKYGNLYSQDNVVLSGTHTHSGPAGYFQYTLFMLTSKGYLKESITAIVNGIVESIDRAHDNMKEGRIFINKGREESSSLNRSPHAYLNNPAEERKRYTSNTDKDLIVLKFTDMDGDGIAALSWFAVHPVSMNNTNLMISSDNMGYASYLFEEEKNTGSLPGEGPFVAAFSSSDLGDASPNTRGPHCINTGESCDSLDSSCPVGGPNMCMAMGPGLDMFESTKIIGENIYRKAKEIYRTAKHEVSGPIHFAHQWVNMTDVTVQVNSTHTAKTCNPALGYSFAAGTIDGVGGLNFTQGSLEGDPFWDGIRDALLGVPSNETKDCHSPKPILLNTGEMNKPLPWHPDIVDVQIITIGSLAVVAVPGEFTTMSGRRLREAVKKELESNGNMEHMEVVLAGLCNVYTHYISTYEEYQVQRYEGASTIYGPHTLSAYIQLFRGLARAIATNTVNHLPKGPQPPFFSDKQLFTLMFSNQPDKKPTNTSFGDVLMQVLPSYRVGEVADVTFVSGNPRNSVTRMKTFLTIEKYDNATDKWEVVHNDASWETRFHWKKEKVGRSNATIEWHIPHSTLPGIYKIRHFGHYKELVALKPVVKPYEGSSDIFKVYK